MPCCDAASLATPAAASQEGGLAVATGLHRQGRRYLWIRGVNSLGPACSTTCLWEQLHRHFPYGISHFLVLRVVPECSQVGTSFCAQRRWDMKAIECCWMYVASAATMQGRGRASSPSAALRPPNSCCPSGKECLFLQEPSVIQWKDRNNFKLPGLYKLYWEWKLVGAPRGVCDYGSYNAHLSCWAVLVCALLAAEVTFIFFFFFFFFKIAKISSGELCGSSEGYFNSQLWHKNTLPKTG